MGWSISRTLIHNYTPLQDSNSLLIIANASVAQVTLVIRTLEHRIGLLSQSRMRTCPSSSTHRESLSNNKPLQSSTKRQTKFLASHRGNHSARMSSHQQPLKFSRYQRSSVICYSCGSSRRWALKACRSYQGRPNATGKYWSDSGRIMVIIGKTRSSDCSK